MVKSLEEEEERKKIMAYCHLRAGLVLLLLVKEEEDHKIYARSQPPPQTRLQMQMQMQMHMQNILRLPHPCYTPHTQMSLPLTCLPIRTLSPSQRLHLHLQSYPGTLNRAKLKLNHF